MGSARFGGQIDASGILADVYDAELRNREALAGAASRRAREEQNALDRDAQSRWQSGEMSDEDWLNYVRTRVRESAQFPEEKAEWEKVLRESSDMISVNQAEAAFQSGGSINQLIAFYQQRAKGQGSNSVAGRESQNRLNQLLDQRLGDEVARRVDEIQDQIDNGQAKPQALLDYLKGARGQARANSDLARSLDRDIDQVEDGIAKFNREFQISELQHQWQTGQITGTQYADGLRQHAEIYAATDPSTYFSLLAEASVGDRYGKYGFDGAVGGGGRGSGGGGRGSRGGPITLNGLSAEWEDRRWRAADILTQVMRGETMVTDPGTGQKVDISTAAGRRWIENVNRDAFSTFAAQRRVGTELGDPQMVQGANDGMNQFLFEYTQPSNTLLEREAAGVLLQSITSALRPGGPIDRQTDPALAARDVTRLADDIDRYIAGRTSPTVVEFDRGSSPDGAVGGGSQVARGPESSLDPAFIGELTMVSSALRTGQFDPDMNVTSGFGDLVTADDMKFMSTAASVIHDKATGMGTRWTYAVLPGEGVSIVPMVIGTRQQVDPRTGQAVVVQTPMPDPAALAQAGVQVGESHNQIAVAVQVGDTVMRMNGYSSMQATPWNVWASTKAFTTEGGLRIEKGMYINAEVYNSMSEEERATLAGDGSIAMSPYLVETFQAPDSRGRLQTFTRLPGGSWVKGTYPIKPNQYSDGTVALDADGSISGTVRPVSPIPVPFMGTNAKLAQEAIDRGEFDDVISQTRGVNWETMDALPDPFDASGSFWTPEDDARRQRQESANREAAWNTGQRQGDWWNQKSRAFQAADRWNAQKRATREASKASETSAARAGLGGGMLDDLFGNEGASLGVSFGAGRSRGGSWGANVGGGGRMNTDPNRETRQNQPASWPTEQMPRVNLPTIRPTQGQQTNVDFLPSRLPAPQASSGPFITRTEQRGTPRPQPSAPQFPSFLSSFMSMAQRMAGRNSTPPPSTTKKTGTPGSGGQRPI
jgi:hypothetical protein